MVQTHRDVHHVSSGLGAGQHGGYAGPSGVVRVHVNGDVWEAVPQSAHQEPGGLRLQQAGHVLTEAEGAESGHLVRNFNEARNEA